MNPRRSLRKLLGLYEHELNAWLEQTLRHVRRVIDVGANDGYFTFGAAAAFRRLKKSGEIIAFESQQRHVDVLHAGASGQRHSPVHFEIVHALVGRAATDGVTTLDALQTVDRRNTLVKIDVEGAEWDVVAGAATWMDHSNRFVIEVHRECLLDQLRDHFFKFGHELRQVNQRPLPFLGREVRDEQNWWLVSATTSE